MELTTLTNTISTYFQQVAVVNDVFVDDVYDRFNSRDINYTAVCLCPESASVTDGDNGTKTASVSYIIHVADRQFTDNSNVVQIWDVCQSICEVVINKLNNNGYAVNSRNYQYFSQSFSDNLAGVTLNVSIDVLMDVGTCEADPTL